MARLVVRRDRDVDELERRVGVAEGDDGDVDVGCLADSLVVDARVRDDDDTRLLERARNVVRERAGREAASDRLCARVRRKLEDRTLPVRPRADDTNVVRVLDRREDACCEDKLLPGLADVDNVDAWPYMRRGMPVGCAGEPSARRFHT